jgi:hypothetical protein
MTDVDYNPAVRRQRFSVFFFFSRHSGRHCRMADTGRVIMLSFIWYSAAVGSPPLDGRSERSVL